MKYSFIETHSEVEIFERCFRNQLPLMIKGPTGCGKTQLVHYMSEKLKTPLVKVACNEDTSSADLLGRFLMKGNETIWQDGPVTRAVRNGFILYLDEIAEAREDVIVALHSLTDHRRELYLDKTNETVKAPASFMCVTSFNPGYQQGFKELKPSTRQRFVNMSMNYLDPQLEKQLLMDRTGLDSQMAMRLVQLAVKIRSLSEYQMKETVSSRLLIYAGQLIQDGMNSRIAAHLAIAETLSDDQEVIQALKDLVDLSL